MKRKRGGQPKGPNQAKAKDFRAYGSWKNMRLRCRYPGHQAFPYYGGRGISVCERWSSFWNFLADMGECPVGMSIDRIDPDKDYEPANCRWANRTDQSRNRRNSTNSVFLATTSKTLGMSANAIRYRIRHGIPLDVPKHDSLRR